MNKNQVEKKQIYILEVANYSRCAKWLSRLNEKQTVESKNKKKERKKKERKDKRKKNRYSTTYIFVKADIPFSFSLQSWFSDGDL